MSEIVNNIRAAMKRGQTIFRGMTVVNLVEHAEKLEAEVERLHAELRMRDITWLPEKDAQIEKLIDENKTLRAALLAVMEGGK